MPTETLVAAFDTPAHAGLAVADLREGGIDAAITGQEGRSPPEPRPQGFWATLFGIEPGQDSPLYDHLVANGVTIVSARVSDAEADAAARILMSHAPIDLDARAPAGTSAARGTSQVRRY